MNQDRYGLIAGNGRFPFLVVEGARKLGEELSVVAIKEETDSAIEELVEDVVWVGIGKLGKMLSTFKERGINKVVMAGQVKHVQLFSGAIPDMKMVKMLWNLPRRNTDALIGGIAKTMEDEGIELIDSTHFVKDLLADEGVMSRRKPSGEEEENIEYGISVANQIAGLDLGQTIVVRGRACVAVEAMEGTDAVIKRAGELVKGKLAVIKVAKPNQDMRFDVPVIGVPTIETMLSAGAKCISVTAGKTLMFEREELLALADKNGICVTGHAETNI